MKKCPECNNLIDESLTECNICGYPFKTDEDKKYSENKIVRCPECDEQLSEKDVVCPKCGYPIKNENSTTDIINVDNTYEENSTTENIDKENSNSTLRTPENEINEINKDIKRYNYKYLFIIIGLLVILLVIIFLYFTSDFHKYNSAERAYKNKKYAEAAKIYKELDDYKDSNKKYKNAKHKDDVSKDKIPPTISMDSKEIKLKEGENFDPSGWISDNVVVDDNVSSDINLEIDSSNVDTNKAGECEIIILAKDEAGNEQVEHVKVVVNKKYTQTDISNFITSITDIPGLQKIEYEEKGNVVSIHVINEVSEVAYAAKTSLYVKTVWARLTDSIDGFCKDTYNALKIGGYDVEAVGIYVSDGSDLLYVSVNGNKFFDVSDN